jgi:hypothetical protein
MLRQKIGREYVYSTSTMGIRSGEACIVDRPFICCIAAEVDIVMGDGRELHALQHYLARVIVLVLLCLKDVDLGCTMALGNGQTSVVGAWE